MPSRAVSTMTQPTAIANKDGLVRTSWIDSYSCFFINTQAPIANRMAPISYKTFTTQKTFNNSATLYNVYDDNMLLLYPA